MYHLTLFISYDKMILHWKTNVMPKTTAEAEGEVTAV